MEEDKKLKLLKEVARILRRSKQYVKAKSDYHTRFDFRITIYPTIEVFNAKKEENLFLWVDEMIAIARTFDLSYYLTCHDGKLVFVMG